MRNLLKVLAIVAVAVPALALAAITNSRHDLSNVATHGGIRSTAAAGTDQTCVFCHTPHRATQQALIWSKTVPGTVGWAANTATTAGTTLPTNLGLASRACLSCHDGTTAIGQVSGGTTFAMEAGNRGTNLTAAGLLQGSANILAGAGSMSQNHPVSVAYPGGTGAYNGTTSLVAATNTDYRGVLLTGCATPTGLCTDTGATGSGTLITIYREGSAYGIECGSCHDVHNRYPDNAFFLRASQVQSAICMGCHSK